MHRYLKSESITNWPIGILKVSPFLEKIQLKSKSSSRFFSAVAVPSQNFDYSSGEDKQSFVPPQNICRLDSTQVCNNLHNLITNPSVAIAYFKDCERLGFCPDISTYTAIVSILFNSNQKQSLVSLFSNLISLNTNPGHQIPSLFFSLRQSDGGAGLVSFALDALLKAYSTCKRAPQEAADVFFHLGKLGFLPTVQCCNFLLSFVADAGEVRTLISVFEHMIGFDINLDAYSFKILMKFFLDAKEPSEAGQLLGLMEQAGLKPNRLIYLTFLSSTCAHKSYDFCCGILQAMVQEGMEVRPSDLNMVILGFCKESRPEEAEKLLQTMSVSLDQNTFGYLITAYCKKGDLRKALDLCEEMDSRGIESTFIIVMHRLQCFCKLGMNNEVLVYLKKFKESGIVLDKVLYNIAINAHRRLGLMKEAMELIKEMRIVGLVPDTRNYTCLIAGFFQKREIVNAHAVFAEMLKWGLKPDLVTYNVLLSGSCRNGLVDAVHDLLEQMSLQGMEPSVDTYCLVIKSFCKVKHVREAEVIFNTLVPDGTTYHMGQTCLFSSMVYGYLCQDYTECAYKLFLRFSEQGYLIDKMVCGHLVCKLCDKSYFRSAYNVVKKMFRANQLNVFICTTLMNGYCRAGNLHDACKLFDEMTHAGMKPDVVTYTVLLDGQLKEDLKNLWLEKAKENKIYEIKAKLHHLTRCMEDDEIERDVICYTVLIDGQCKIEYLDHAQQLFDEMQSKGLRPDVPAYTALINGYCSQDKIEKAKALFQEMVDSGLRPDPLAFAVLDKVNIRGREMQRELLERI